MVIGGDREKGSLKLILARPVYREDVINGKALGVMISIIPSIIQCVLLDAWSSYFVNWSGDIFSRYFESHGMFFMVLYALAYYSIAQFF